MSRNKSGFTKICPTTPNNRIKPIGVNTEILKLKIQVYMAQPKI